MEANFPCSIPNGSFVIGYLKFLMVGTLLPLQDWSLDVVQMSVLVLMRSGEKNLRSYMKGREKYKSNNVLTLFLLFIGM